MSSWALHGLLVTCELAEVNPLEEISWSTQLATSASFLQKEMLLLLSFVDWIEKCFALKKKKKTKTKYMHVL